MGVVKKLSEGRGSVSKVFIDLVVVVLQEATRMKAMSLVMAEWIGERIL